MVKNPKEQSSTRTILRSMLTQSQIQKKIPKKIGHVDYLDEPIYVTDPNEDFELKHQIFYDNLTKEEGPIEELSPEENLIQNKFEDDDPNNEEPSDEILEFIEAKIYVVLRTTLQKQKKKQSRT